MKKTKRIIAMILVLTIAVSLAACGKKDGDKDSSKSGKKGDKGDTGESVEEIIADINNYVYKSEPFNIASDEYVGRCKIFNDTIYIMSVSYDYPEGDDGEAELYEEDTYSTVIPDDGAPAEPAEPAEVSVDGQDMGAESTMNFKLLKYDLTGNKIGEFEKQYSGETNVPDFSVDKDGNILIITEEYRYHEDTGNYAGDYSLICMNDSGDENWNAVLKVDNAGDYFYPNSLNIKDDMIIVSTNAGIYTFDKQGNNTNHIGDQMGDTDWNSSFLLKDGRMAVVTYSADKPVMSAYNLENGKNEETFDLPFSIWNYSVNPGTAHDLILSNSTGLFYYNFGDKEVTKMIDYIASDLCTYSVYNVCEIDDKTFYGCYYDDLDESENPTKFAKFTKIEPKDAGNKTVLSVGGMYIGSDVRKNIILFNRSSDKYRIITKDYSVYDTDGDYSGIMTIMNNDIIAGTMPDIMLLNTSLDINNYFVKGTFEPLDKYIDNDPQFNRSDYMENVLDTLSFDGKLYCITPSFYVNTMIGKKSVVGDKNLSLDELDSIAKDCGSDTEVFLQMSKEQFIRNIMYYNPGEFINYETGEVKFDSPEFIKILEFTDSLKDEIDYGDYDENWRDYETAFLENRALVTVLSLYDFRDSLSYYRYAQFGEELGFIGFPTSEGSGNTIGFENAFAISASSKNKDAAWEFLRDYLSDDFQDKISWGYPLKKSSLEKMADEALKPRTYINDKGEEEEYKDSFWINDKEIVAEPLTKAEIDSYMNVIKSADKLVNYNESISDIIIEEAQSYFSGQKDAASVAKIIQSRVQIYVNENR